jgi:hypothetical protein
MPAASKSNIHGHIHGKESKKSVNTAGVEEYQVKKYSSRFKEHQKARCHSKYNCGLAPV